MSLPVSRPSYRGRHRARVQGLRPRATAAVTCVVALLAGLAALVTAGPAAANPAGPHDPIGRIFSISSPAAGQVRFFGWGADPDALTSNATVYGLIDGRIVTSQVTSGVRPVATRANHLGATPGFDLTMTVPTTGTHTACLAVRNVGPGVSTLLGCTPTPFGTTLTSSQVAAHSPTGTVAVTQPDSGHVRLTGWATDPDFLARRATVVVYVSGTSAATVLTHLASAAQRAAGSGPRGAFDVTVPVSSGSDLVCVWFVNVGLGANYSPGCTAVDTRGRPGTGTVTQPAINKMVVTTALKQKGKPYVWGAEGPKSFDCSGLVQFSYGKAGFTTPRVAADQFAAARVIPASRAVAGDLVFWHDGTGAVYHVGIYISPGMSFAAMDPADGINYQQLWYPDDVTYGSFTHT